MPPTKKIYGVGLLVGERIKIIGWSLFQTSRQPGPVLIQAQQELDQFNKDHVEAYAAVGVVTEPFVPARICRFEADETLAAHHTWLAKSRVKMMVTYKNFEKGVADG